MDESFIREFYGDAIRDFDRIVEQVVRLEVPGWMDGLSQLPSVGSPPLGRPVYGVSHFSGPTPDGYGALGMLSLIECGRTAAVVLVTNDLELRSCPRMRSGARRTCSARARRRVRRS
jgi:hypothetical protein